MSIVVSDELNLLLSDYLKQYPKRREMLLGRAPGEKDDNRVVGMMAMEMLHIPGRIVREVGKEIKRMGQSRRPDKAPIVGKVLPQGHEELSKDQKIVWLARVSEMLEQRWQQNISPALPSTFEEGKQDILNTNLNERDRFSAAASTHAREGVLMILQNYIDRTESLPKEVVEALKPYEAAITPEMREAYSPEHAGGRMKELSATVREGMNR